VRRISLSGKEGIPRQGSAVGEVLVRVTRTGKRKRIVLEPRGTDKRFSYPSNDVESWAIRLSVLLDVDDLEDVFWMLRSLPSWGVGESED
jgi:hypothetical protein